MMDLFKVNGTRFLKFKQEKSDDQVPKERTIPSIDHAAGCGKVSKRNRNVNIKYAPQSIGQIAEPLPARSAVYKNKKGSQKWVMMVIVLGLTVTVQAMDRDAELKAWKATWNGLAQCHAKRDRDFQKWSKRILEEITERKYDVNKLYRKYEPGSDEEETLLHRCAWLGNLRMVKFLIEKCGAMPSLFVRDRPLEYFPDEIAKGYYDRRRRGNTRKEFYKIYAYLSDLRDHRDDLRTDEVYTMKKPKRRVPPLTRHDTSASLDALDDPALERAWGANVVSGHNRDRKLPDGKDIDAMLAKMPSPRSSRSSRSPRRPPSM